MNEEWKPLVGIPEIDGEFEISNMGRIKRVVFTHKGQKEYKSLTKQHAGYYYVMFSKGKWCKCCRVHRLVAIAFVPNPNRYAEVNHIDGDKSNNSAVNLEWCTRSQNEIHKYNVLGYDTPTKGMKFNEEQRKRVSDAMRDLWRRRKADF